MSRELNASLVALVLSVSRNPAVAREIDSELPPRYHTRSVLKEAQELMAAGAKNNPLTAQHGLLHSEMGRLIESVKSPRGLGSIDKTCSFCSGDFWASRKDVKYCCDECRRKADSRQSLARKARMRERRRAAQC